MCIVERACQTPVEVFIQQDADQCACSRGVDFERFRKGVFEESLYSITIGWAIIAEASLSFLGFGLPPDVPSWGTLLSREGRQYMEMAPRLAMWPGVALTLVVYCLNMVGDTLRDLLDPGLRGGGGAVAGGAGARAAEHALKALQKLERTH